MQVLDQVREDYRVENSEIYKKQRVREEVPFYKQDILVLMRETRKPSIINKVLQYKRSDLTSLVYGALELSPELETDLQKFKEEFPNLYPHSLNVGLLCYVLWKQSERFEDHELPELFKED